MDFDKSLFDEINNKENDIMLLGKKVGEDSLVVIIEGSVDTYNSQDFNNTIIKLYDANIKNLIFDMSDLMYISSTGVGVFVSLLIELKKKNINLFLYKVRDKVYEIFKLLGFISQFNIIDNISDIENKEIKSVFPKISRCPHCDVKIKLTKSGKFKCKNCKKIFIVTDKGEVRENI